MLSVGYTKYAQLCCGHGIYRESITIVYITRLIIWVLFWKDLAEERSHILQAIT